LMKEVGAKKVVIGKLEGEFKDKLEFQGRQIEIMFFK